MKYHVIWGEKRQTVITGNPMAACIKMMQDQCEGEAPSDFYVYRLVNGIVDGSETFEGRYPLSEVVSLLVLANQEVELGVE